MYITDPFQFHTAGFRLAGMMFETQMRVMFVLTDAALGGKTPFVFPGLAAMQVEEERPAKPAQVKRKPAARAVKTQTVRKTSAPKRKREPAPVPSVVAQPAPAHPAE